MTPEEALRAALRDLVRDVGPVEALHTYIESLRWPILPPDSPNFSAVNRVAPPATPG